MCTDAAAYARTSGIRAPTGSAAAGGPPWGPRVALVVGGMMLGGAALNTVLVVVKPDAYSALGDWFAELSPWQLGPLEDLWDHTFGEHPRLWGAVVGVGYEATVGVLALSHDPRRRLAGLYGAGLFKGGLLAMGLWGWAVPWLAVLLPTIAVTARAVAAASARPGGQPTAEDQFGRRRSP